MQLLLLAPRPDIAYDLCDYIPLCKDEEAIESKNTAVVEGRRYLVDFFIIQLIISKGKKKKKKADINKRPQKQEPINYDEEDETEGNLLI